MLFRAKRKDNWQEIKGCLFDTGERAFIIGEFNLHEFHNKPAYLEGLFEVHRNTLAMDTTIPDKNGKPIFGSFVVDGKMSEGGDECELAFGHREEYIKINGSIDRAIVIIEQRNGAWGFRHKYPELVVQDDKRWRSFWKDEDEDNWEGEYFEIIGPACEVKE